MLFGSIEFSNDERARSACRNISYESGVALESLKRSVKQSFDSVWNNENATPQQIMDVFGVNASKLFYASSETQKLIKKLDPSYEFMVSPNVVVINQDGTVTVGDLIPESENGNG